MPHLINNKPLPTRKPHLHTQGMATRDNSLVGTMRLDRRWDISSSQAMVAINKVVAAITSRVRGIMEDNRASI